MELRRVVVTGTGLITPVGNNVADTWKNIVAGKSGFGEPTLLDGSKHTVGGVCEVKDFDFAASVGRREARRRDRVQLLATVAANEAMAQSKLEITDDNRENIGIYFGTGIGGIATVVESEHQFLKGGVRKVSPFAITKIMPNGAAGMLAIDYGIQGPSVCIATACAAGSDAIGYGFHAVQRGDVDAAIVGGAESVMVSVSVAGFEQAGATSSTSLNSPKPFSGNRDGLIAGEGAGMLVIETLESAQARGAEILGEIVGYGQTTDAHHITAPAEGGAGAVRAIKKALKSAGLEPTDIDFVSAHGTGTVLNDKFETMAIKTALGEHAYNIPVVSTKSMTGHVMGGTGAIESVFCLLTMRDDIIPPTINYETQDDICDLDYVPNHAREGHVDIALNNAFGFGGHNAVLILKRWEEA